MDFRIADTFTDSLGRLTGQEQKAVKTTAFDLQMDPASPSLSFHKLDRAQDKSFWSVRVNADIRLIVHRTASSLLLAYVDHHDKAYGWAERRRIERHPTTGAMQTVVIRERVEEVAPAAPPAPARAAAKPRLFDNLRKLELMGFGVPEDWVEDVRRADEDTIFDVIKHLPQEAQEALLKLAVGERPAPPEPVPAGADPFAHPDAQRRFRVMHDVEELGRALDAPWDKWAVFLHPGQKALVERTMGGPARVSGSAGTGKTVVALHRAVHLARVDRDARILLTTFTPGLARALRARVLTLVGAEPAILSRITVEALPAVAADIFAERHGPPRLAPEPVVRDLLAEAAAASGQTFVPAFLLGEWADVVDAWQLRSWEAYRDVSRLGRKTRIGGKQREALWGIFARVRAGLAERGLMTAADVFGRLTDELSAGAPRPFDAVVVDEAQDLGIPEARFLAALAGDRPDGLFFAGDIGQRIFQQAFSWKSVGLDVRGRSATLRVNYRTSHQIRQQADRLLPAAVSDVDGTAENRRGTVSMFDGPQPAVRTFPNSSAECADVAGWLRTQVRSGVPPHEIAVIVRSDAELERAREAAKAADLPSSVLDADAAAPAGHIVLSTMHYAKGQEFRAVAVMACDDEVIPLSSRIEAVTDPSDLDEVYATERHLLYVACTRARDHLLVTAVQPASEFLEDLTIR